MKFSQIWCMIVVLLLDLAAMVSFLSAQTEDSSAVNVPSSAEVQSDSVEAQPSSDEPEQKQPTLAPSRDIAAAQVKTELLNELRSELLDARTKTVDWWLEATAIFLTLLSVAAAILGYFGFKRLDRIESEARESMEASAKSAQNAQCYEEAIRGYVKEAKTSRDELQSIVEEQKSEVPSNASSEDQIKKNIQQKFGAALEQAVAAAMSFEQQNKIEEAIEKWCSIANIIEETDADLAAEVWLKTGQLLSSKSVDNEDWGRVVEAYNKAIKLNPNLMAAYNDRGNARYSLGQYRQAIADYDEAIERNPDNAEAYYNRGNARYSLGQYRQAIADYDEAIERNPDNAEAYNNRGSARFNLGQDEQAMADYNEAIRWNPDNAKAYYNRGRLEVILDLMDEAQQDFQTALNLIEKEDDIDTDLLARVITALDSLGRGDAS